MHGVLNFMSCGPRYTAQNTWTKLCPVWTWFGSNGNVTHKKRRHVRVKCLTVLVTCCCSLTPNQIRYDLSPVVYIILALLYCYCGPEFLDSSYQHKLWCGYHFLSNVFFPTFFRLGLSLAILGVSATSWSLHPHRICVLALSNVLDHYLEQSGGHLEKCPFW